MEKSNLFAKLKRKKKTYTHTLNQSISKSFTTTQFFIRSDGFHVRYVPIFNNMLILILQKSFHKMAEAFSRLVNILIFTHSLRNSNRLLPKIGGNRVYQLMISSPRLIYNWPKKSICKTEYTNSTKWVKNIRIS